MAFLPTLERRRAYDVEETPQKRREWAYTFDPVYGNLSTYTDFGEVDLVTGAAGSASTPLTVSFDYARPHSANSYTVGFPKQRRVCSDAACTKVLNLRRFTYDMLPWGKVSRGDRTLDAELVRMPGEADRWASTQLFYDPLGRMTKVISPEGSISETGYTSSGSVQPDWESVYVTRGKAPNAPVTLKRYYWWDDVSGRIRDYIDVRGRHLHYDYDSFGRPIELRSSPSDVAVTPGTGNLAPATPSILLATFAYRTGEQQGQHGVEARRYHDGASYVAHHILYDGLGRSIQVQDPRPDPSNGSLVWSTVSRRFDYDGRVKDQTLPRGAVSTPAAPEAFDFSAAVPASDVAANEYDWWGRIQKSSVKANCSGSPCEHGGLRASYDLPAGGPWSMRVERFNGDREVRQFQFDARGRIARVDEFDRTLWRGASLFTYDRQDRIKSLKYLNPDLSESGLTSFTYDSRGLQRSVAEPNRSNCGTPTSCPWRFEYDLDGRLTRIADPIGAAVRSYHDELDRVYWRDYCDNYSAACLSNPDGYFDFDGASPGLLTLARLQGTSDRVQREYDVWGRLIRETQVMAARTAITEYSFDDANRLQLIRYPPAGSGRTLRYAYGASGHLSQVDWIANAATDPPSSVIARSFEYDMFGRLSRIAWGSGLVTSYEYNSAGATNGGGRHRLRSTKVFDPQNNAVRFRTTYVYSRAGNVTNAFYEDYGSHSPQYAYEYDHADRLTRSTFVANTFGRAFDRTWRFGYSPNGNLAFALNASPEGPWRLAAAGATPTTGINTNAVAGFHFKANENIVVSQLCGYFDVSQTGPKSVRLWRETNLQYATPDAEAAVSSGFSAGTYSWNCTEIEPVRIGAGETWTVAVTIGGHGAASVAPIPGPPNLTAGRVTITAATSCNGLCRPTTVLPTATVHGLVDIGLLPRSEVEFYSYGGTGVGPHGVAKIDRGDVETLKYNARGELITRLPAVGSNTSYFYSWDGLLNRVTQPCQTGGYRDHVVTFGPLGGASSTTSSAACGLPLTTKRGFSPLYSVKTENGMDREELFISLGADRVAYFNSAQPGNFTYLHSDERGSIAFSSTATGAGESATYFSPFGEQHVSTGVRAFQESYLGFAEIGSSGVLQLGARAYDPRLRHWLSPDQIVADGSRPQSLNRYSYAFNNPVRWIDTTGYQAQDTYEFSCPQCTVIIVNPEPPARAQPSDPFWNMPFMPDLSISTTIDISDLQTEEADLQLPPEPQSPTSKFESAMQWLAFAVGEATGVNGLLRASAPPERNPWSAITGQPLTDMDALLGGVQFVTTIGGFAAQQWATRPYWQYYPASNPAYGTPWLTRGAGSTPPYPLGSTAAQKLALPSYNPATAVRPVSPSWWRYIAGPRNVAPKYGQPGGGIEFYPGGFPPW
jgi:RHS repeat-associated protein